MNLEPRLSIISSGCCPATKSPGYPPTCTDEHKLSLLLFVRVEECVNFSVHSFWPLKRQRLWRFLGFFLKQKIWILVSDMAIPEGTHKTTQPGALFRFSLLSILFQTPWVSPGECLFLVEDISRQSTPAFSDSTQKLGHLCCRKHALQFQVEIWLQFSGAGTLMLSALGKYCLHMKVLNNLIDFSNI